MIQLSVRLAAASTVDAAALARILCPRRVPAPPGALNCPSQPRGDRPLHPTALRLPVASRVTHPSRATCPGSPAAARAAPTAGPAMTAEHPAAAALAGPGPGASPARRCGSSLPWETPALAISLPHDCLNDQRCAQGRHDDDGNEAGHPEPEEAGDEDENAHAASRDEDAGNRRVTFAEVLRLLALRPCLSLAFNLCRNLLVAHAASLSPFRRGRVMTCRLRSRASHSRSRRGQNVFSSYWLTYATASGASVEDRRS